MICPYCGEKIEDGQKFCPNCGKPVQMSGNQQNSQKQQQPVNVQQEPKKKKKKGSIILIFVIAIIAIIFIAAAASSGDDSSESTGKKLGTIGDDISFSDLDEDNYGDSFKVTGEFWDKVDDKGHPYLFMYSLKKGAVDFRVKDKTDNKVLSALDDASYKDEIPVNMSVTLDDIEYQKVPLKNGKEAVEPFYYVTATSAEIKESDDSSDDTESDSSNSSDDVESNSSDNSDSDSEERNSNYSYYGMNEDVKFTDGLQITVTDAGVSDDAQYTNAGYYANAGYYTFVNLHIEDIGDEEVSFSTSDVTVYADDYDTDLLAMDSFTKLKPGKMADITIGLKCDYESANKIELYYSDAVFEIK